MIGKTAESCFAATGDTEMALVFRTVVYITLFVGFLLIYLPSRILLWTGIAPPAAFDWMQIAGTLLSGAGGILALWCFYAFVRIGKGTPAFFDSPRRLVIRGPYRFVRNPMYLAAALLLAGAALYYRSVFVALYCGLFLLAAHLFVVLYEEPALRRGFGADYESYCRRIRRWRPFA